MTNKILDYVEFLRLEVLKSNNENKLLFEQYFSSSSVAKLMASMLEYKTNNLRILDPGAGVGSLFAACIDKILSSRKKINKISVTTFEIDPLLNNYLRKVLKVCKEECQKNNINFSSRVMERDFIKDSADKLGLGISTREYFNCIILNPPYQKINSNSITYKILNNLGLSTTNTYSAFLLLCKKFLEPNGEMISITPRSFCNGLYFKTFRKKFLENIKINKIHIFNSRRTSFRDHGILQENIIVHSIKSDLIPEYIRVSSNESPDNDYIFLKKVEYEQIVRPNDPEKFIYIISDGIGEKIFDRILSLKNNLRDLELSVSTGKVVDFRTVEFLSKKPLENTVPFIHLANINSNGFVNWPIENHKKYSYIMNTNKTRPYLVKNQIYVLTKRFSSNEEKKRIVASIYNAFDYTTQHVGFENRVNYFHKNGNGLDITLAKGLTAYLNSTIIDAFFRQFNGHTQVNATDLRNMPYPSLDELKKIGEKITNKFPRQDELDRLINKEVFGISQ